VADTLDIEHLKKQKRLLNNAVKHWTQQVKDLLKEEGIRKDKPLKERLQAGQVTIDLLTQQWNEQADHAVYFHKEEEWLTSRFPAGSYVDVAGLCKIVSRNEIAVNDYSLTAGRYVGVGKQVDDGFDYEERMGEIKLELQSLNEEAVILAKTIQEHLNELGL